MMRLFFALLLCICVPLASVLLDSFWPYVAMPFLLWWAMWIAVHS